MTTIEINDTNESSSTIDISNTEGSGQVDVEIIDQPIGNYSQTQSSTSWLKSAANAVKKKPASTSPTTGLPLSRVKRIIKLDEDVRACSNSAAYAVTIATELFIQFICEQGSQMAKADKRKGLQYKDLANAVHRTEELEFLSDVIPRTVPLGKVLKERSRRLEKYSDDTFTQRDSQDGPQPVHTNETNTQVPIAPILSYDAEATASSLEEESPEPVPEPESMDES
ncbi:histone-fold-containing protein [Lipomyces japonicus]|uniref:histone-fold-containing protein n=1 Tax=Lipomyces japonicus TaxID=56871 RepID=UPI0034CD0E09